MIFQWLTCKLHSETKLREKNKNIGILHYHDRTGHCISISFTIYLLYLCHGCFLNPTLECFHFSIKRACCNYCTRYYGSPGRIDLLFFRPRDINQSVCCCWATLWTFTLELSLNESKIWLMRFSSGILMNPEQLTTPQFARMNIFIWKILGSLSTLISNNFFVDFVQNERHLRYIYGGNASELRLLKGYFRDETTRMFYFIVSRLKVGYNSDIYAYSCDFICWTRLSNTSIFTRAVKLYQQFQTSHSLFSVKFRFRSELNIELRIWRTKKPYCHVIIAAVVRNSIQTIIMMVSYQFFKIYLLYFERFILEILPESHIQ